MDARRLHAPAAVALLVLAAGCGDDAPRRAIPLTEPSAAVHVEPSRPAVLRIGVGSVSAPAAALPHYRELVDYLGERLGVTAEVVQRASHADLNELLRRRHCDAAFVCAYAHLRASREFGVVPVAMPRIAGSARYRAYVLVRDGSRFERWEDLAGARFAFADPMCNAGWLYPAFRAAELGRPTRAFFGYETYTYSYEKSIRAVAEGLVDAASVEGPVFDALAASGDPAAAATRILERSPEYGTAPVVAHPSLDPELRGRIAEFLLSLHDTQRGRAILAGIGVERFVVPDPASWDGVLEMSRRVEGP